MKKKIILETLLYLPICFVLLAAFDRISRFDGLAGQLGALGSPLLFLYFPLLMVGRLGLTREDIGVSLTDWGKDLRLALMFAFVVLPPFVVGYWYFWGHLVGRPIGSVPDAATAVLLFWNIVAVAIPEEVFFRGLLQTRLSIAFPKSIRLGPLELTYSNVMTSMAFALAHLLTVPKIERLAVFFPSLLFGMIRERSRTILAPALFHFLCNATVVLLAGSH